MSEVKCPVCSETVISAAPYEGGGSKLNCVRCGLFEIGIIASNEISVWNSQQRINLSGWIRDNQNCKILSPSLTILANLPNLPVGEKAEKILMQLARKFPKPGQITDLSGGAHLEFLGVGRLADTNELQFFMRDYLCAEMNFLLRHKLVTALGDDSRYSISPKGWAYLESLRHGNPDSQIGFVAMWFDEEVKDAWVAVENGIRDAGYKPFRVDQKEHNNDITDEIIAGIRGSKFLVADLTRHRNGVYFEAGFARGLGLEVVWLCRKSDEKDRHFDIRQLNCIFWEEDKLPELTRALTNRIVATIGRGALTTKA
jgi:hypothetical protein